MLFFLIFTSLEGNSNLLVSIKQELTINHIFKCRMMSLTEVLMEKLKVEFFIHSNTGQHDNFNTSLISRERGIPTV